MNAILSMSAYTSIDIIACMFSPYRMVSVHSMQPVRRDTLM